MKTMAKIPEAVISILFAEEDSNVFAVLDGASVPNLLDHLYASNLEFECLYRGELQPDMAEVAPYLVMLQKESEFTDWVVEKGWGNHWGIFAFAQTDLRVVRRHFRSFLVVHDSSGKPLYFRYYDPRVLRVYLSTCNSEELTTMFGPIHRYALEDEKTDSLLVFSGSSGKLSRKEESLVQE